MLAPEITNHVTQALARLMQQYQGLPNLTAVVTALVDQVQDLEDAIFDLNEGRQLYNGTSYPSVGAQLDGIGEIVGVNRNGLTDAQYLIIILGTIAENNSDTTINTLVGIVQTLFSAEYVFSKEMFPACVAYGAPPGTLPESLYGVIVNIIQNSLGASINLVYLSTFEPNDAFTMAGGSSRGNNGFGDINDPSVGGGFATLIYNNPHQ